MKEVYVDEKGGQNSDSSSWGGGGGSGGGGGGGWGGWGGGAGWGGGGGSGDGGAGWGGDTSEEQKPEKSPGYLRLTAGGCLMMDETGDLLFCCQECPETPMLTITLKRDSSVEEEIEDSHARCIQVNLVYTQLAPLLNEPGNTLSYDLWPEDASSEEAHYAGNFFLPDQGEVLTVKVMWQKGHHDINELSKMKVTVCGVDCGTKTFSRNNWKSVATIKVDKNGRFTVNGLYGKLRKR